MSEDTRIGLRNEKRAFVKSSVIRVLKEFAKKQTA